MNLVTLALAGMRGVRLNLALTGAILALGLGTLTLLLLVSDAMQDRLLRDARGIDLVLGAKGSPLQLVLSTVFQVDVPTGNIPLSEAQAIATDPLVAQAVPLALGDAARGFRIVGTTPGYLALYHAQLSAGGLWHAPMEAVLGAVAARALHLAPGDHFTGAHGVLGNGPAHSAFPYTVTGILAPTCGVIDRLILTPVESVWRVHEGHRLMDAGGGREVTAVLLRARTPLALIALPYRINRTTPYQMAVPSQEWARLLSVLGFGFAAFRAVGWALVVSASLAMLLALLARMRERRGELAVLRLLGASKARVFALVAIEALGLALVGGVAGLLLGHAAALAVARLAPAGSALSALQAGPRAAELAILGIAAAIGAVATAVALLALYRRDVAADLLAGAA